MRFLSSSCWRTSFTDDQIPPTQHDPDYGQQFDQRECDGARVRGRRTGALRLPDIPLVQMAFGGFHDRPDPIHLSRSSSSILSLNHCLIHALVVQVSRPRQPFDRASIRGRSAAVIVTDSVDSAEVATDVSSVAGPGDCPPRTRLTSSRSNSGLLPFRDHVHIRLSSVIHGPGCGGTVAEHRSQFTIGVSSFTASFVPVLLRQCLIEFALVKNCSSGRMAGQK